MLEHYLRDVTAVEFTERDIELERLLGQQFQRMVAEMY